MLSELLIPEIEETTVSSEYVIPLEIKTRCSCTASCEKGQFRWFWNLK